MAMQISDREVSIFLHGISHAIKIAENRPDRVSIIRAMKNEWTELLLRQERRVDQRRKENG